MGLGAKIKKFWWDYIDKPAAWITIAALRPLRWFFSFVPQYLRKSAFYTWLKERADNPAYGAAVALIGFIAAAMGSIHSAAIKDAFPFCCTPGLTAYPWNPLSWQVSPEPFVFVFWASAFLWLYLYMVQEDLKGEQITRIRSTAEQIGGSVSRVNDAVQEVKGSADTLRNQSNQLIDGVSNVRQDVVSIRESSAALQEQSTNLGIAVEKIDQSIVATAGTISEIRSTTRQVQESVEHTAESAVKLQGAVASARTKIDEVNQAVQTLPPKEFRTKFAGNSLLIYTLVSTNFPRRSSQRAGQSPLIVPTMRSILAQLLRLRQLYEQDHSSRYAANIMHYLPRHDDAPHFPEGVIDSVRSLAPDPKVKPEELSGALILRRELSTSTDDPTAEDSATKVAEIALGIPQNPIEKTPWILPGAAETFIRATTGKPTDFISGHYDTENWDEIRQSHGVSDEMFERMRRYFAVEGREVRSYISLPLLRPNGSCLGVLNLHSSEPYAGGNNKERQLNFGLIVMPLVHELAELCLLWATENGLEPHDEGERSW